MPAVQVRDFSQETYEKLCQEAKLCGRSIAQQTKMIVCEHLAPQTKQSIPSTSSNDISNTSHTSNPFYCLDEIQVQQRKAKREKLFERINQRNYPSFPDQLCPATVVRQMRDER